MLWGIVKIFFMVVLQNAAFTLMSRARNSDSLSFNAFASVFSNGMWVLVFRQLAINLDKPELFITYVIASVVGSVTMHHYSMQYLEKLRWFKKKPKPLPKPLTIENFDGSKATLTITNNRIEVK